MFFKTRLLKVFFPNKMCNIPWGKRTQIINFYAFDIHSSFIITVTNGALLQMSKYIFLKD